MKIKTYPHALDVVFFEDDEIITEAMITSRSVPFSNAWQLEFAEVLE